LFKDSRHLIIDYGRLLQTIQGKRRLGAHPILVGSCPPPMDDSLWVRIREDGFKVILYNRNIENKEKKVDTTIALHMCEAIFTKEPAILALIAGDGDYYPQVEEALKKGWTVEIWF